MAEAKYSKSSAQLDLEARQSKDYVSPSIVKQGVDPVMETENGFIGVDPIYQNFSDVTHKPFVAEKGPEAKVEKAYVSDKLDLDAAATPEGESEATEDAEDASSDVTGASGGTPKGTSPASPATPPATSSPS